MTRWHKLVVAELVLLAISQAGFLFGAGPEAYKNFKVTVFIPVQVVQQMGRDPAWMQSGWQTMSSRLHVDKVFIESYRSGTAADGETLSRVKDFFLSGNGLRPGTPAANLP